MIRVIEKENLEEAKQLCYRIKREFDLTSINIKNVRVLADGSKHYECFLDWQ